MKKWSTKNYKTTIIAAFLIPIIIVAFVSIFHVTVWYGIANPLTWASYLSIGIEIAALSALAAISANMGSKVYFPFVIVTIIQFIGNIFFSYQYIDINSKVFKDWVDLVAPLMSVMGVEPNDMVGQKRMLSLFSGGLLPLISLSFLHMLVKFSESKNETTIEENVLTEKKENIPHVDAKDLLAEVTKVRLSDEEIERLENILLKRVEEKNETPKSIEESIEESVIESESIKNNEIKTDVEKNTSDDTLYDEIAQVTDKNDKIESTQIKEDIYDFENEEQEIINDEPLVDTNIETPNETIEKSLIEEVESVNDVVEENKIVNYSEEKKN